MVESESSEASVFDPCSFYGHIEYDVGTLRSVRHEMDASKSMEEYQR